MATWPATLPQVPLAEGWAETPGEIVIRAEVDTGPAKVRRRATAASTRYTATFRLTPAQRATLLAFWRTTIAGGAEPFNWSHPVTGDPAAKWRFLRPPTFTPWQGGIRWLASLELELLP